MIYYILYIIYHLLYIISYHISYVIYHISYIIILYIYIYKYWGMSQSRGENKSVTRRYTSCHLVRRGWEVYFLRCCQESCWHVAVCLAAQQWMSGWEEHGTPGTGCPKAEPCTRRSIFGHCGIAWTWFPLVPCRDGPVFSVDAGW